MVSSHQVIDDLSEQTSDRLKDLFFIGEKPRLEFVTCDLSNYGLQRCQDCVSKFYLRNTNLDPLWLALRTRGVNDEERMDTSIQKM